MRESVPSDSILNDASDSEDKEEEEEIEEEEGDDDDDDKWPEWETAALKATVGKNWLRYCTHPLTTSFGTRSR